MKLTKYGLLLGSLALLASCSDNNVDAPEVVNPNPEVPEIGTTPLVNIAIAIPNTGTRVTYEDGEDLNEYAVKDATLYLYSDNDGEPGNYYTEVELDAYFDSLYDEDDGSTTNDITSQKVITKLEIAGINPENTYWALVILNKKGLLTDGLPKANESFATWASTAQTKAEFKDGNYFTMTNALGWDGNIPTLKDDVKENNPKLLVKVEPTDFYYENEDHTGSVNIYVQRCMAKVTLDKNSPVQISTEKYSKVEIDGVENKVDLVQLTDWWLDVTNTTAFPIQNLDGPSNSKWYINTDTDDDKEKNDIDIEDWSNLLTNSSSTPNKYWNRFLGGNKFHRVFWAIDPNYNTKYDSEVVSSSSTENYPFNFYQTQPSNSKNEHDAVFYCHENTFDVLRMHQTQSTRVVFKGTYFIDEDKDATTPTGTAENFLSYKGKRSKIGENLELEDKYKNTSTTAKITELFKKSGVDGAFTEEEQEDFDEILKNLDLSENTTAEVNLHINGVVYYSVIIRHFEDDELGIDEYDNGKFKNGYTLVGKDYYEDGLTDSYLLGRFGVVRNNWYELKLKSVAGPGEPTIPTPEDIPDDDPAKLYLNCTINILSWAKRSHGYDL